MTCWAMHNVPNVALIPWSHAQREIPQGRSQASSSSFFSSFFLALMILSDLAGNSFIVLSQVILA